jgi:uncharacterized protein (TIGR02271 family)
MTNLTGAQTPAAAGSVSSQAVAMFDTYDHALAARDALLSAGIERSRIELLGRSAAENDASFRYERNEEGFWAAVKNMFMPEDESHFYAEGINRGHTMLVVRGPIGDEDRIISLLESQNPLDVETHSAQWRQSGWSGIYAGQAGSQTRQADPGPAMSGTGGREEVIPVYQEQLRVGKREVDRGSVRVRSYVVETPVQEQVRLHEERVEVERRPVDRPATAADAGAGAFKDRTIEVTATAEEAVVAKETRVKEEIVVRKEEADRTETVSDTVRHTEVEVENDRASDTRTSDAGVTPGRRP